MDSKLLGSPTIKLAFLCLGLFLAAGCGNIGTLTDWQKFVAQKQTAPQKTGAVFPNGYELLWNKTTTNFELQLSAVRQSLPPTNSETIGTDAIALKNGKLTITNGSKILWQSPASWWVDSFVIADSNHDNLPDINASVWKAGDFGPSHPFWITAQDESIKNHFFVLDWKAGKIMPVWESSNLEKPNCEFAFADLYGNNKPVLVTLEGEYRDDFQCTANHIAVWNWNGWGFSNEWRDNVNGTFKNLTIQQDNQNNTYVDIQHSQ